MCMYIYIHTFLYTILLHRYEFSFLIAHGEDEHLSQRRFQKEFSISWPQHWSLAEGDFRLMSDSNQLTEV